MRINCLIFDVKFTKIVIKYTVCKFQDFSVTQILREINFRQSKSVFFPLNFVNLVIFSLQKLEKLIDKNKNLLYINELKLQTVHF